MAAGTHVELIRPAGTRCSAARAKSSRPTPAACRGRGDSLCSMPRARGDAVDEAEIDRAGRAAVRRIVGKQREAGIDVGNNGEQQRDHSFSISRPGYPASAEAGSGPRAPTSTAIRNSGGCGRSSTSARPRSPRWAGCRRRSARCDISTIAPSMRSAAISEPYSTRRPAPSSSRS